MRTTFLIGLWMVSIFLPMSFPGNIEAGKAGAMLFGFWCAACLWMPSFAPAPSLPGEEA